MLLFYGIIIFASLYLLWIAVGIEAAAMLVVFEILNTEVTLKKYTDRANLWDLICFIMGGFYSVSRCLTYIWNADDLLDIKPVMEDGFIGVL